MATVGGLPPVGSGPRWTSRFPLDRLVPVSYQVCEGKALGKARKLGNCVGHEVRKQAVWTQRPLVLKDLNPPPNFRFSLLSRLSPKSFLFETSSKKKTSSKTSSKTSPMASRTLAPAPGTTTNGPAAPPGPDPENLPVGLSTPACAGAVHTGTCSCGALTFSSRPSTGQDAL